MPWILLMKLLPLDQQEQVSSLKWLLLAPRRQNNVSLHLTEPLGFALVLCPSGSCEIALISGGLRGHCCHAISP